MKNSILRIKNSIDANIIVGALLISFILLSLFLFFTTDMLQLGDDYYFHERRIGALAQAIYSGAFPAYIDPYAIDNYGYLSNIFYPDIILLPFVPFIKYVGIQNTIRIIIFVFTILCGIFTYSSVYAIFKDKFMASLCALLFSFCNYRLFDIFSRFALGEALSFTFVPIVFLGIYHIIKGNYKRNWYIIALGFTLMIYTHILSTFLIFIILVIFLIIYNKTLRKQPKRFLYLVLAGIVTLFCTTYTLVPMIEQMWSQKFHYQVQTWAWTVPAVNTIGVYKLLWGLTSAISLPTDSFIPRLGLLATSGVMLRLFISNSDKNIKNIDNLWKVGLILLLAITIRLVWEIFPLNTLTFIQFPWRLFEFVSFLFLVVGSYYLSILVKSKQKRIIVIFVLSIISIYTIKSERDVSNRNLNHKKISITGQKPHYITNGAVGWGFEFISDRMPSYNFYQQRGDSIVKTKSETQLSNFKREQAITSFDVYINQTDILEIPLNYYKGYAATLNNEPIDIQLSKWGLIDVPIHKSGHVEIYYKGTPIHKYSFYFSLVSLFLFILYSIRMHRINKKNKKTIP